MNKPPSSYKHPYAYANGNPVMFWDLNGLEFRNPFRVQLFTLGLAYGLSKETLLGLRDFATLSLRMQYTNSRIEFSELRVRFGGEPLAGIEDDYAYRELVGEVLHKLFVLDGIFQTMGREAGSSLYDTKILWEEGRYFASGTRSTAFVEAISLVASLPKAGLSVSRKTGGKIAKFVDDLKDAVNQASSLRVQPDLFSEYQTIVKPHDVRVLDDLAETSPIMHYYSRKYSSSAEPFAFGSGPRYERVLELIDETSRATGLDFRKYVDIIEYELGSSYFEVVDGTRVLTIGSNAFTKTKSGQILEALHELTHAQKWHHTLHYKYKGDYGAADFEFSFEKGWGTSGYAFDERIAEGLALRRLMRVLELTPQQRGASTKYIESWRRSFVSGLGDNN